MSSPELLLGNRYVGPDHKPLVIAEIGINHNGSYIQAVCHVEAAARRRA
jgi:N-acetylneuraminate synthase